MSTGRGLGSKGERLCVAQYEKSFHMWNYASVSLCYISIDTLAYLPLETTEIGLKGLEVTKALITQHVNSISL